MRNHDIICQTHRRGNSTESPQGQAVYLMNVHSDPLIEELLKTKKGSIRREFPREWIDRRWSELERAARNGDRKPGKRKSY